MLERIARLAGMKGSSCGSGHITYAYDGDVGSSTAGDLIQRTDIGKFNYSTGHAPTHAFGDTPGATAPAAINQGTQAISYTTFLKAATISEQVGSDAYLLTYTYGTDHQRSKSELKKNGNSIETRIYCGAYEEQRLAGTTNKIHYVNGPGGLCAMIVQADGVETIYYVYKDHLGSIVTLTKAEQGGTFSIAARQNFDPWGRQRNPTDWTYGNLPAQPDWIYRGYTGHEHVAPFALINMNGRMYDPLNGRMLSADNYVQGFLGSQGFNRYSYAGNNPFKYTDPSGEFIWFVAIGALIGSYLGASIQQGGHFNPSGWGNDWWKGAVVGGIAGAGLGFGLAAGLSAVGTSIPGISAASGGTLASGSATSTGFDLISNALITANVNMASEWMQGGDWNSMATSGLVGLVAGGIGGAVGHVLNPAKFKAMSKGGIKATNLVTGGLNGFGTRYFANSGNLKNGLIGALEGLYLTHYWGNSDKILELGSNFSSTGRFVSGLLTQSTTSVPGLGLTVASYHAQFASARMFFEPWNQKSITSMVLDRLGLENWIAGHILGSWYEAYFHLAGALGMYGTLARRWTEDYPALIRPGSW